MNDKKSNEQYEKIVLENGSSRKIIFSESEGIKNSDEAGFSLVKMLFEKLFQMSLENKRNMQIALKEFDCLGQDVDFIKNKLLRYNNYKIGEKGKEIEIMQIVFVSNSESGGEDFIIVNLSEGGINIMKDNNNWINIFLRYRFSKKSSIFLYQYLQQNLKNNNRLKIQKDEFEQMLGYDELPESYKANKSMFFNRIVQEPLNEINELTGLNYKVDKLDDLYEFYQSSLDDLGENPSNEDAKEDVAENVAENVVKEPANPVKNIEAETNHLDLDEDKNLDTDTDEINAVSPQASQNQTNNKQTRELIQKGKKDKDLSEKALQDLKSTDPELYDMLAYKDNPWYELLEKNEKYGTYNGFRVTSQFSFCNNCFSFDTYDTCTHKCLYCFSYWRSFNSSTGKQSIFTTKNMKTVNPLENFLYMYFSLKDPKNAENYSGAKDMEYLSKFFRNKVPIHWGGNTDPFFFGDTWTEWDNKDKTGEPYYKVSLIMLKIFAYFQYPIVFSTKSTWLHKEKAKQWQDALIQNKDNIVAQVSLISIDNKINKLETGTTAKDRLDLIQWFLDNDFNVIVRCQPFIPGVTDRDLKEYVDTISGMVGKNGKKIAGLTVEFLKFSNTMHYKQKQKVFESIYNNFGVDLRDVYSKRLDGFVSSGGEDFALKTEVKNKYFNEIKKMFNDRGIPVYAAENELRALGDDCSCCGIPMIKDPLHFQKFEERTKDMPESISKKLGKRNFNYFLFVMKQDYEQREFEYRQKLQEYEEKIRSGINPKDLEKPEFDGCSKEFSWEDFLKLTDMSDVFEDKSDYDENDIRTKDFLLNTKVFGQYDRVLKKYGKGQTNSKNIDIQEIYWFQDVFGTKELIEPHDKSPNNFFRGVEAIVDETGVTHKIEGIILLTDSEYKGIMNIKNDDSKGDKPINTEEPKPKINPSEYSVKIEIKDGDGIKRLLIPEIHLHNGNCLLTVLKEPKKDNTQYYECMLSYEVPVIRYRYNQKLLEKQLSGIFNESETQRSYKQENMFIY